MRLSKPLPWTSDVVFVFWVFHKIQGEHLAPDGVGHHGRDQWSDPLSKHAKWQKLFVWSKNGRNSLDKGKRKKEQRLNYRGLNCLQVHVWWRGSKIYNLLQTSETYSCTHVRIYSSRISNPCSLRSLMSMQIPDFLLAVGKRGSLFKLKTSYSALIVDRMSAILG